MRATIVVLTGLTALLRRPKAQIVIIIIIPFARFQVSHTRTPSGTVVSFLNVTNILTNDGGLFKCQATSKVGSAEHQARIDVRGLPYVKPMKKMSVVAGQTLVKTCPVAGYPIHTITWEMSE